MADNGAEAEPRADVDASHLQLNIVTRVAELGIWDWDLTTQSFVYSPRAKAICGLDPDLDVTLEDLRRVTHPDDLPWTSATARRVLDPQVREVASYEYRILRPDGQVRWVVAHGEAMFAVVDGQPRAVRYVGTLQDVTEQRRQTLAERRGAEQLRLAFEAGRIAVWNYDVASQSVAGTPELNLLMGFAEDATPSWADFQAGYMPGEEDRLRVAGREALQRGARFIEHEFRYRRADGVVRWFLVRTNVVFDDGGRPSQLVGIVMDIDDRKSAEIALQESQLRFQAIADSAPSPVWVTLPAGGIEFVNQAFADYAGRPREELLGDRWVALLHSDDVAAVASARAAGRANTAPYSFEARFRHANGEYRWMLATSKPRFDPTGEFTGYVGMAVDLTEMHLAQEALRESETRFRAMAEEAPVLLWLGDEAGACQYLNRALRTFWGVSEDVAGFAWSDTLVEEDRPVLLSALDEALAEQRALEVEARYYRADGAVRVLLTRALPRRDGMGRFLGMIGVNTDVTELREAAAKQRLLINELNHRVKNTLSSVQSIVRQSVRDDVPSHEARQLVTDRLMALSKAHDVLTRRDWENASLMEIVNEATRPFDDASNARFAYDGPTAYLEPNAAMAVAMALHELGTNAVKYGSLSASGGTVAIGWAADGPGSVRLEWRETGGPLVRPPTRFGFGSRLLQTGLAADLGGTPQLDFEPGGIIARLSVKTLEATDGARGLRAAGSGHPAP